MPLKNFTLFFFLLTIFCNTPLRAETIIIVGDQWCPYNCEANSPQKGYMIELAKIIFERAGHNIDYQVNTWVKSISDVRKGKASALVATSKLDAPDLIFPENNMGLNRDCFYVRAHDKWSFDEIKSLNNRKLGMALGYAYTPLLNSFIRDNPKSVFAAQGKETLSENIKNLDNAKIDTLVENPFVFNFLTTKRGISDKYEEAGCIDDKDLYIAFSPKNPRSKEFAKILDDGLEKLRIDGTLEKIKAKYSIKDWR